MVNSTNSNYRKVMLEEYNTLGRFVITHGEDGPAPNVYYYSSDGITWATASSIASTEMNWDISWSPDIGLFLVTTTGDEIYTSPTGVTWTYRTTPSKVALSTCWSKEKGIFVNAGYQTIGRSSDGINFTWVSVSADYYGVCWSKERNLFMAVGDGAAAVVTSPDGANWTTRSTVGSNRCVCYSPELDMFLIGRPGGGLFTGQRFRRSTDGGVTWQNATTDTNSTCWSVVWAKEISMFIAKTTNGIWTSSDGDIWIKRRDNGWETGGVCWSNELSMGVVVGGGTSVSLTTTDGINWTATELPVTSGFTASGHKVVWAP